MSDWQPIASAPKDGREILIGWTDSSRIFIAIFEIGRWRDAEDGEAFPFEPTHWMPLPEPPKAKGIKP